MKQTLIFTTLFLAAIFFSNISFGQTQFDLPQNIELKTKQDYTKYETTFIDAAKWLEETDLDKEADKRQQINAFVLQWISGSPTINIEINEQLGKIYGKNAQLLGLFLASYAGNIIENKNSSNKFSATKAGLISIMKVYKKRIEITKSKEMDKIIMLTDVELDSYIRDKFK